MVFLKLAMSPNEVTLWSGKDRQGEKVAIQRSDGKANTPIMAYFPPCWFVPKDLDPMLCRASLLQEAEEWVESERFPLHGGLSAVPRSQGVDEGIAVNRDDRHASRGKRAKPGSNPVGSSHTPKKSGESSSCLPIVF